MNEELSSLIINVMDRLDDLIWYNELIEIAKEQYHDEESQKRTRRIELLIEVFLTLTLPHAQQLKEDLERIHHSLSED